MVLVPPRSQLTPTAILYTLLSNYSSVFSMTERIALRLIRS
jgi:ATP-dependent phosphoenolpyruvate carboxykinase